MSSNAIDIRDLGLVGLLAVFTLTSSATAAEPRLHSNAPRITDSQLSRVGFVRISVTDVLPRPGTETELKLVIKEVIVGSNYEIGETFRALVDTSIQSIARIGISLPAVQKGDEALWLIQKSGMKIEASQPIRCFGFEICAGGFVYLPVVLNAEGKLQDQALKLAFAIKKTRALPPRKRWGYLVSLCESPVYSVSGWAMTVLANADASRAITVLRRISASNSANQFAKSHSRRMLLLLEE